MIQSLGHVFQPNAQPEQTRHNSLKIEKCNNFQFQIKYAYKIRTPSMAFQTTYLIKVAAFFSDRNNNKEICKKEKTRKANQNHLSLLNMSSSIKVPISYTNIQVACLATPRAGHKPQG